MTNIAIYTVSAPFNGGPSGIHMIAIDIDGGRYRKSRNLAPLAGRQGTKSMSYPSETRFSDDIVREIIRSGFQNGISGQFAGVGDEYVHLDLTRIGWMFPVLLAGSGRMLVRHWFLRDKRTIWAAKKWKELVAKVMDVPNSLTAQSIWDAHKVATEIWEFSSALETEMGRPEFSRLWVGVPHAG